MDKVKKHPRKLGMGALVLPFGIVWPMAYRLGAGSGFFFTAALVVVACELVMAYVVSSNYGPTYEAHQAAKHAANCVALGALVALLVAFFGLIISTTCC